MSYSPFQVGFSNEKHRMPGTKGFQPVITCHGGAMYEWDDFYAWYSPAERRYYWGYQSGCSCNAFELYDIADMRFGTREDLARAFREWASTAEYPEITGPEGAAKIRMFKENK
jgi:hypothetical protein